MEYFIYIGTLIAIYATLPISLNLLVGYTGQISVGHGAFMSVGAYTAANLAVRADLPFWVTLPAGGLMAATYYGGISVVMGVAVGLKAFTAAIVGGVGNFKGAVLGGFVVALLESFTAGYFYGGYKEAAVFALLILLLIFRPEGILGEA